MLFPVVPIHETGILITLEAGAEGAVRRKMRVFAAALGALFVSTDAFRAAVRGFYTLQLGLSCPDVLAHPAFGWDGVNLLPSSSCGALLWICDENC